MFKSDDILIAGRSCRLPGANDYQAFARLLFDGKCAVSSIPQDRWAHWRFTHPKQGVAGKSYSQAAGVLDDIWGFDPKPFNISPREAMQMDPQQRILLQVVWEALDSAHITPAQVNGQNVGVYVGASSMDFITRNMFDEELTDVYSMTGGTLSVISNRISYAFNTHGPSMTVDTACSSSLVALNEAFHDLKAGRIEVAIVAGVNILLNPMLFIGFSAGRFLSPEGLCKSFSDNADGYVRSEGAVTLVLRRADSCIGKTAPIYGRVLGVNVNSDGRTSGIALPEASTQAMLLKQVYEDANVQPDALSFIEAHGTGTQAGDAAEANSIGQALAQFRQEPLPIGSVKSNIGHLEPAAGLAGILKSLVAFEYGKLPASLHFDAPNQHIDFEANNIVVANDSMVLPDIDSERIAGISSFGFGGTNAHVIIGDANSGRIGNPSLADKSESSNEKIAVLSAFDLDALQENVIAVKSMLEEADESDVCSALIYGRDIYPERLCVLNTPDASMQDSLDSYLRNEKSPYVFEASSTLSDEQTIFIYSGNGAQYAGMCHAAYHADDQYKKYFEEISNAFEAFGDWSLVNTLSDPDLDEKIKQATIAQPLLFADQVALSLSMIDKGVKPNAVLGHSGGEIAAAYVCGALTLDQALRVIFARGKSQELLHKRGTMGAILASADAVQEELDQLNNSTITIAAINSPKSVTLTGPEDELEAFRALVKKKNRWATVKLKIDYPYHSPMQDEIETVFRDALQEFTPSKEKIPFYSSVSAGKASGETLDIEYWWRLLRQPVKFMESITAAQRDGFNLFVECGPQPVLTSYVMDTFSDISEETQVTHTFEQKDTSEVNPVYRAMCRAIAKGAKVDKGLLWPKPDGQLHALPSYPWQNVEYRMDLTDGIQNYMGTHADNYEALGKRHGKEANVWTSKIDAHLRPDLADHVVHKKAIVPGTFFMEAAIVAARQALNDNKVQIRDVDIQAPLVLSESSTANIRTEAASDSSSIIISSRLSDSETAWMQHMSCRYGATYDYEESNLFDNIAPPNMNVLGNDVTGDSLYATAHEMGLHYGPSFQNVSHVRKLDQSRLEVILCPPKLERIEGSAFDAIRLDSLFHGLLAGLGQHHFPQDEGAVYVPVHVAKIRFFDDDCGHFTSGRIKIERVGKRSIVASFDCFNDGGKLALQLLNVRFSAMRISHKMDINSSSYHFVSHPLLTESSAKSVPQDFSPNQIASYFTRSAEENTLISNDISYLLIEAICQRIAFDAVSTIVNAKGMLNNKLARKGNHDYINLLLQMLQASGLASLKEGVWYLDNETDLPLASDQISAFLAEYPQAVSEALILSRLAQISASIVSGEVNLPVDQIFGSEVLKAFAASSISTDMVRSCINGAIKNVYQKYDDNPGLRVAILSSEKHKYIDSSITQHSDHKIELIEIEQLNRIKAQYDLLIVPEGVAVLSSLISDGGAISNLLLHNGMIATFESVSGSMNNMLHTIAFSSATDDQETAYDFAAASDEAQWLNMLGLHSANPVISSDLEGGLSGYQLFIAAMENQTSIDTDINMASAVKARKFCHHEFGNASTLLEAFKPIDSDRSVKITTFESLPDLITTSSKPSVLIAVSPTCDTQELLEEQINYISKKLLENRLTKADVWLILSNGYPATSGGRLNPYQFAIWAFARTAQNELSEMSIKCVDLDNDTETNIDVLIDLIKTGTEETELLISDAQVSVLRVETGISSSGSENNVEETNTNHFKATLMLPSSGRLDDLHWVSDNVSPPHANEVQIDVSSTGLNYRDVMWALGMLPEEALENGYAGPTLGIEYSGYVRAVGEDITDFKIGDLVASIGPDSFSSRINVDHKKVFKLPDNMDDKAAATIPVAFFTAYYSLIHLARLEEGETVLIHGAAGGVGLAAVQIAKAKGAIVIGTAGTDVKRDFLKALDVDHVLNSRSLQFSDDVEYITRGKGVDVVLNSLSGEAMALSLSLLRPFGRFLEIGKQDFYQNTKLGARALKENISYFGIDADQIMAAKPNLVSKLFAEIMTHFHEGVYVPLPYRAFDSTQVVEAFRLMQRSAHVGKIVVEPCKSNTNLPAKTINGFQANRDGVHVIVGGTGGLGLETALWLARCDARHIVLLSRGGLIQEEAKAKLDRLYDMNVNLRILKCDVSNYNELSKTLDTIREEFSICGIIHAAMVLQDAEIKSLDRDILRTNLSAKVTGASNLHALTQSDTLDYFILFSSVATMIGNIGQSAYVAANAYMEGLAKVRRAQGLPALAIGWGAITDAGYLTREQEKANLIAKLSGNIEFSARDMISVLEELLVMEHDRHVDPNICITPMSWSSVAKSFNIVSSPTFSLLSDLGQSAYDGVSGVNLRASLEGLPLEKMVSRISDFIVGEISTILRISVAELNLHRPVADFGMDSLMGVEFAMVAQEALGDDIPMSLISIDEMSITDIAAKLAGYLMEHDNEQGNEDKVIGNLISQHVAAYDGVPEDGLQENIEERENDLGSVLN